MNKIINQLNNENLLSDFPDKTYQLCILENVENNLKISFNSSNNSLSYKRAAEYINSRKYSRVILVCRHEKEPWASEFPTQKDLSTFIKKLNCKYDIFYQEPWPTPVPNFNLKDTEVVIRFGYDEGLDINKWSIESTLDVTPDYKYQEVLITNSKIINL